MSTPERIPQSQADELDRLRKEMNEAVDGYNLYLRRAKSFLFYRQFLYEQHSINPDTDTLSFEGVLERNVRSGPTPQELRARADEARLMNKS